MIETKLRPPVVRPGTVPRRGLLERLDDPGRARLVLVSGGAGSGKTTLVGQWVAGQPAERPVAWLTLDTRDNDPRRLWDGVGAAVRQVSPATRWPGPQAGAVDHVEAMAEALGPDGPAVLVLDDLHCLVDDEVVDQLDRFVGALPDQVHLVMLSRGVPALPLARRRAGGELVEIVGTDLMFSREESAAVLAGSGADDPALAGVHAATGGWPVAVGLTAQAVANGGRATGDWAALTRRRIADYLTEEILLAQSEDVRRFLLDVAVLDDITADAADAVRSASDSGRRLDQAERDGLLLWAVGPGGGVWRYHPVVSDHLRRRLERTEPDRWLELHRRASAFEASRDPDLAVAHALMAGDHEAAARLLESQLDLDRRYQGDLTSALRSFEAMPDPVLAAHPGLRAFALNIAERAGRSDLAGRWLRARPLDRTQGVEDIVAESWQAILAGDVPRLFDACLLGLVVCDPASYWFRVLHGNLAIATSATGDWTGLEASLQQLLIPAAHTPEDLRAGQELTRSSIAVSRAHAGDPAGAAEAFDDARAWVAEAVELGYRRVGLLEWAEAMLAYDANDFAAAARWDDLPDAAATMGREFLHAQFVLDQARVRRAAGDTERARELLTRLRVTLAAYSDPGMLPEWAEREQAALDGRDPVPARRTAAGGHDGIAVEPLSPREVEVLRLLRTDLSLPEIASYLYVSYNTVKTHTRLVYRKLGASGRAEAVARGREQGYG